jgi:3-hydroxyacyl-CoA dehydrogenase/enoyl-CoA hydratase/3-hydroxybutyryl-CoA epimerase
LRLAEKLSENQKGTFRRTRKVPFVFLYSGQEKPGVGYCQGWDDSMTTQNSNASSFQLVDLTSRMGGTKIWTLVFDTPGEKVNKLSKAAIREFEPLLKQLEDLGQRGEIEALALVSGKPGNFIAGADINMFEEAKTAEEAEALSRMGQKLFDRWEDLPFPTVAVIDGAALGGGCELSLACRSIVMSDSPQAKIGLPETMLGIIPGTGGCIRLPVKVGLATALDMILTGKTLSGEKAYKAGLADAVIPRQNFEESALKWIKLNLSRLRSGERIAKEPKLGGQGGMIGSAMELTPVGRHVIFSQAKKGVLSKTKGKYPAPLEAIAVMQDTGTHYDAHFRDKDRDQAMAREAQGFGKLAVTDVSRNLVRIFFMTEAVKKSKGLPSGKTAAPHSVHHAAVLGAGVMGGGIAQLYAEKNIPSRMKDITTQALALGMQSAASIFKKQVQRRKINKRQLMQKMNLISPVLDFSGFKSTDVVVEAVVENLDVKKKVIAELETHVKDDCVIASNTSSLSITKMQQALKKPERFVGMHFFNPVSKMPLIEVIRGEQTSDEAVSTIFQFSKQLGKTPIVVKDAPGFLVNRLLVPYLNEAAFMLSEGVSIEDLDRAMLTFGMPMGPVELIDEVGIDVGTKVAHILNEAFGARMDVAPVNDKLVQAGYLGKKNGKGFYQYENGKRGDLTPNIYELLGVKPENGKVSDEEIVERCVLPMINEATRCLDEQIVASPEEVDLGMIMGTGFPPFRGGLMRYADELGAQTIVDRLRKYAEKYGSRFEPAPGLIARAQANKSFY